MELEGPQVMDSHLSHTMYTIDSISMVWRSKSREIRCHKIWALIKIQSLREMVEINGGHFQKDNHKEAPTNSPNRKISHPDQTCKYPGIKQWCQGKNRKPWGSDQLQFKTPASSKTMEGRDSTQRIRITVMVLTPRGAQIAAVVIMAISFMKEVWEGKKSSN